MQQQSQPAFGAPAPAFGASTPAFGAAPTPAFGASSAPAFGSTSFGAKPAGGFGFGAASTPSAFGAASAPAFGASSSAFGAPSPFGGGGSTFGQSAPAFGAASTPAFGQAAPAFGAAAPAFGQQPAAGGFGTGQAFGAPAGGGRGSRVAPWRKTQETDQSSTGTKTTVYFNSISCMPEYAGKSPEELRWEDYQDGVKGGSGAASPGQSGGLFGQPSVSPSPFGQPAASSPFGAPTSTPAFGAASTPAFGAASTPAFGGFGAASTPAFGGISSPAFGGFGAASTPAFGATSAPAFGATSTPAFGGFGAASTPAFGAASSSAFGAPSSTAAFGFGATSTPAFGATSTPAFGAASTPAFGGFGAASTPAFGATSAPAFGATSTPAFSFSAASTPAFGATSAPAFGAASTPLFGAASTPAFGSTGGSLFGGAAQKPATGGFSFTPTSTPAFGATSTPAFGAPSSGGLFGAASTPAFGTGTGGLFGAQTSTPAFSFSSQPAAGQLALVPAGGVGQAQPPGVATSPYGTLPEAPKVTPLPEYRVGLTQRMLAPPSGGPPRPVALITPRSLTPHGGAKLRPRRPVSATRMSRSPAEFFAAAAAGAGGTLGLGLTPSTVSTTPGNGSVNGTPGSSNIFVPRDNPRKLFIREPLPSTEAAGGVSVSPAAGGNGANGTPARSLRTPGSGLKLSPGMRRPSNDMVNGSGEGLGRLRHENGAGASGQGISDAQVSALLPSLRRQDYYTEPSLVQLAAMAREEPESLAEVANFTVGRRGVGAVRWLEPVDVRGLDLDALVDLARGSVEVYLEGGAKPDVGEGLNRPAEVTMLKVFKLDKDTGKPTQEAEAVERFTRKLKKIAAEQSARFVSYDGATGTWKFEVEHFSRYGLVDGSDEEDETDFGMGDDRTAAAVGGDSDDSDEELGVRRRRGGANAANGSSGEVVVAGEEEGRKGEYREEEEREVAMDEGGIGSEGAPVEGHGEAAPKALLVALPERLGLAPEDLLRIR